jgi:hypothetical protein
MIIQTKYPEVYIDINITDLSFKIVQMINGKHKVRRRVCGRPIKRATKGNPSHDMYGNQLYKQFNDVEDAKQNALNFVDNFLKLL